jgi:hypothetical protein
MVLRIEDYALIGDCETAALVGRDGRSTGCAWPRFDSGACFAALLGTPDHGRWSWRRQDAAARVTPPLPPGTLILETRFETDSRRGHARRLHAAARQPPRRRAPGRPASAAASPWRMELAIRFDYGAHRALGERASRTARCAPSPAPTWCCSARRAAAGEDLQHRSPSSGWPKADASRSC